MKQSTIGAILCFLFSISCAQKGVDYYNDGLTLKNAGKYEEAIETFSKGIELVDISRSINYYGRAYCYFELKRYEEAKSDLQKSLQTEFIVNENINSDIYWLRAFIAGAEGQRDTELQFYEKAMEYAPENDGLKTTFGLVLIENGQIERAISILSEVLQDNNQDAHAYNNRAYAFILSGNTEKAKADLEASLKLDQENPILFKNFFFYYKALGDIDKACESIGTALSKNMMDYGLEKDTIELTRLKKKFCR